MVKSVIIQFKLRFKFIIRHDPKLTKAKDDNVFSPPDKFEMFFQLFLGGLTENTIPSVNGSNEST